MKIKTVVTGYLDENCYIISQDGNCLVVDPGDEYNKIKDEVGEDKVLGVLITHSHFDHIGALRNFLTKRSIKIFKKSNVEENKEYKIGPFIFKCLYTPGHSKDSISFYFENEKKMFVGDFIFKESMGRTDFPGGSDTEMKESIKKILEYPDDIELYPGHYETTTLGNEKNNNPFLK
ncbi:MAG: MBL fold metallo-hydrolase [Bacilli bacterium]|nr:MBL fold metallo-hydrolase [Bacilli bacterium]